MPPSASSPTPSSATQSNPAPALPPHVQPVALAHAYRLINHGPTVLVSAAHAGQHNVMAAAWNMPLDFDPPKVAVVIDKATYTRQLMQASGWFALNVPVAAQADAVFTVGSVSAWPAGHPAGSADDDATAQAGGPPPVLTDKFTAYGLAHWPAPQAPVPDHTPPDAPAQPTDLPLVDGCLGWLLCRLLPEAHMAQAHDLFVAEVVAAWADERVFTHGKYRPMNDLPPALRTLHHLGAGNFVVPGSQEQGHQLPRQATR